MATTATLNPTAIHHHHHQQPSSETTQILKNNSNDEQQPSIIPAPRGPVTADLTFYSPPEDGSSPFNYVETPPPGLPQRNYLAATHAVEIQDIRGREHLFSLDADAFEALSLPSTTTTTSADNNEEAEQQEPDFHSETSIKTTYYPQVENLLLTHIPGATRIHIFDHTIRRESKLSPREPVLRVHIDQTPKSAAQRVTKHMPADLAPNLLRNRYRIINVWRPLPSAHAVQPVVSRPLAFASGRSARDADLVAVEHRYPDRTGETAGVKFNEGQRWFYWSGMTSRERLLLKCFDSDEAVGQWGRVPHTAFVDPRTEVGWPGRESIEVRALVFG